MLENMFSIFGSFCVIFLKNVHKLLKQLPEPHLQGVKLSV